MNRLIPYKSYKPNVHGEYQEMQVLTANVPINSSEQHGTHGPAIFVGYMKTTVGTKIKCVAVKIVNEMDEYENARNISDHFQKILPREKRWHIIEMIDAGIRLDVGDAVQGILIMEFGSLNFSDMIYESALGFNDDENVSQMLKGIVIALNEFHQIAMHLDVKPDNFLLVRNEIEIQKFLVTKERITTDLWKIADFNGAQLLQSSPEENGQKIAANFHNWPEIRINSALYNSPEYFTCEIVSQKTDIWSVGIIIHELLLAHRFYAQRHFNANPQKSEIYAQLEAIADLFRGFSIKLNKNPKQFAINKQIKYFSDKKSWLTRYYDALTHILHIWSEFPKTAVLIGNLLGPNRTFRMTTNGILDYIGGRCVPAEIKQAQNVRQFAMFNHILVGEFEQMLDAWRIELEQRSGDEHQQQQRQEEHQKVENLEKLMKTAIKKQQKIHETLKKCRKLCISIKYRYRKISNS
uniref:Protein kinase domain-containing protein n=1 Tax=Globodera rostochiensis TaxID=31243 RepID=A0A914I2Q3_GLORO